MSRDRSRAFSVLEYTVMIVALVAALSGMFSFLRNAFSYSIKQGADAMGHGRLYR